MKERLKCLRSFVFVNLPEMVQYIDDIEEDQITEEMYGIILLWRRSGCVRHVELAKVKKAIEELV